MSEEKKVVVEVTTYEVANMLANHMVHGSGEGRAVTNLIIGHLALTEKGLPQLFKALLGILPSLIYKEKDWVYVQLDMLPSWKMDKVATAAALPSVKDGYILAQIIECNVYKGSPYKLAYDVIKDGESIAKQDTSEIREDYIREKAEDFVDILDALEKLKEEKNI